MSLNLLVKGRLSGSELFMQELEKRIATFDVYFWITITLIFDGLFSTFVMQFLILFVIAAFIHFICELRQRTFEEKYNIASLL